MIGRKRAGIFFLFPFFLKKTFDKPYFAYCLLFCLFRLILFALFSVCLVFYLRGMFHGSEKAESHHFEKQIKNIIMSDATKKCLSMNSLWAGRWL